MHFHAATVALFVSVSSALLDHPSLWSNLNKFTDPLASGLPKKQHVINEWASGTISSLCRNRVIADNLDPTTFQGYSIFLDDCAQAWSLCYQTGAKLSVADFASMWSQVPVRMRSWVSDLVLYADGGGAYAYGTTVVLRGTPNVGILIHESEHTCEYGRAYSSMTSATTEWLTAYNADSAVPDDYARNNQNENIAQFPCLIIYDRMTNGKLLDEANLWEIGHQLNTMVDQADNGKYGGRLFDTSGVYCTRRYVDSSVVSASNGSVVSHAEITTELDITVGGDILKESIPTLAQTGQTNCTF